MHGTLVAGLIAARTGNGLGLAAPGVRVELMDLQVVSSDGTIPPRHEAAAIRWAADHGARVVNLSLGALRDPRPLGTRGRFDDGYSPSRPPPSATPSPGRARRRRGRQRRRRPRLALRRLARGAAPRRRRRRRRPGRRPASFSNRDAVHVDLAAPGTGLVSTVPVAPRRAASRPTRRAPAPGLVDSAGEVQGTSFATPQVAGAAALLLRCAPTSRRARSCAC